MAKYTITNPAAATSTAIVQGHDLAPGEKTDFELHELQPQTVVDVDDAILTSTPALPAIVLEQARAAKKVDPRFTEPLSRIQDVFGKTSHLFQSMVQAAQDDNQVVVESTDTPKAKATGVKVTFEMRDSGGTAQLLSGGFRFKVSAVGVASAPATGISIAVDAENAVSGEADVVEIKNGRGSIVVTSTGADTVHISMFNGSRTGITITDIEEVELT